MEPQSQPNSLLPGDPKRRALLLAAAALVVVAGVSLAWQPVSRYIYYVGLSHKLATLEKKDEKYPKQKPSAADDYVNDFKYAENVVVGPGGFSPSTLAVKPGTKVIFTGTGADKHLVAVAPGSPSPKYFDPKFDLTSHTVFQTKFEAAGTYSMYDRYNPAASIVVRVVQ